METTRTDESLCRSIFQNGQAQPTKEQFTARWIELIDRMEKAKEQLALPRP